MEIKAFNDKLEFNDKRIVTSVVIESSFTKEIRILLKEGQTMKEHKTPFPILVHVLEGAIDFGVEGTIHSLKKGEIVTLEGGVKHDLFAKEDSMVRLTLSKLDKIKRVEAVVQGS